MGVPFYLSAINSVKQFSANMDVLVVLGTTAAWGYGIVLIFIGYSLDEINKMPYEDYQMQVKNDAHNFEVSAALITIILIGKYIETLSKKKTVDKLAQLASLKVTRANLIEGGIPSSLDAEYKEIDVDLVQVNDYVKVYPGSGIPVDGIVFLGRG
jgi:Cu+-exporting ATPase